MCDEENLNSLSLECWDYSVELEYLQGNQELELAAELGKTLLARNKELENALKHSQTVIEDQLQEIEYLTKQSVALREVNDSRLQIYEQVEVSIHDLERANHRLLLENAAEKKRAKSLSATIDSLEAKNEELLSTIDDLRLQIDILKKKIRRNSEVSTTPLASPNVALKHIGIDLASSDSPLVSSQKQNIVSTSTPKKENKTDDRLVSIEEPLLPDDDCQNDNLEEISELLTELREYKTHFAKEQRKVTELEDQLDALAQQNQALENQIIKLHHRDEDVTKSVHEEFSLLEEVRRGEICQRCLRSTEGPERQRNDTEETSDLAAAAAAAARVDVKRNIPEDDDSSMLDALMAATPPYVTTYSMNVQDYPQTPQTTKQSKNHYKEFVEKYEALFEDNLPSHKSKQQQYVSLHDELKNSDFTHRDQDDESNHEYGHSEKQNNLKKIRKPHTPTDFSEAETSSSGFAEETSTKSTQTDVAVGSLLSAIADGDDCNIYDEMSAIDSRFKKRPEYRELFREIFDVLKKAAEDKDDVLIAPIDVDSNDTSLCTAPSEAPTNETGADNPDDDTESVQSSNFSMPMSLSQQTSVNEEAQNDVPLNETTLDQQKSQEPVLRPLIRQSFDYIHVERRKRSSSRRKNRNAERSDSPITHIIGSPKISYSSRPSSGRRRRELKNVQPQPAEAEVVWNGNSMQFWTSNRTNIPSPTPSQSSEKAFEFKPSVASQEIRRLKSLDKSYAEVLKLNEGRKRDHQRHRASKGTTHHR